VENVYASLRSHSLLHVPPLWVTDFACDLFVWVLQLRMRDAELTDLSPPKHLAEIAAILAAGLTRLRARKSSGLSAHCGESSLDFTPDQSGHANGLPLEMDA
jgi:hypothetical protein